jgi:methylphosphotriester-DNA--protein-cysteine methyltransferase
VSGYTLVGPDGRPYPSPTPGTLGGHRRTKVYGRLDCPGALSWIARGKYVQHRVFFADAHAAVSAGFRPCARCLPHEYAQWRSTHPRSATGTRARA